MTQFVSKPVNRQVLLTSRPEGIPQASHFTIAESPAPELGAQEKREVLVRNEWLSVEPAMRGWVNAVANYSEPVAIGAVMRSFAVGRVVASNDRAWMVGDAVSGMFGWQDYALVDGSAIERRIEDTDLPMSTALGVLGDVFAQARADLAGWIRGGKLTCAEDVLDGIEHAPDAIAGLYRGENLGKRLIRLSGR